MYGKNFMKMSPRVTQRQASLGTINKIVIEYTKTVKSLRDTAASLMREMCVCVFFEKNLSIQKSNRKSTIYGVYLTIIDNYD